MSENMIRIVAALAAFLTLSSCGSQTSVHANSSPPPSSGAVTTQGALASYADVVDRVAPAVVTIRSARRVRAQQQYPFLDDPFFRQFFGNRMPRNGGSEVEHALGSGVTVRADGYILTNHHVIDGAQDIKVDLSSRKTFSAKVIGSDAPSDLAVLKIDTTGLTVLQLGDSNKVRVGDVCLAVGNPRGIGETVTAGIISAKGRSTDIGDGGFQDFLQTDAPINQGNSGGALVNTRGELIGISSQIVSPNGGNVGIGFAIPSGMAKSVMDQLIGKGKVQRAQLGVGIQEVTSNLAASLGLKEARGILINSVTPDGPADKAGLKTGDIIVKMNGKEANDSNLLRNEIAGSAPGSEVTLNVLRDGGQREVRVRLGELTPPKAQDTEPRGGGGQSPTKLGISVVPLTPDLVAQLELKRGTQGMVVQSVDPNGPAAQAGIQEGDVIEQVNRQPVHSSADLRSALEKTPSGRPPLLFINRKGQTAFVPVPLG